MGPTCTWIKGIAFLIGFYVFTSAAAASQCSDAFLQTQQDVDNFSSSCTSIGNLTVIGSGILNLNKLSSLTSITGKLEISNTSITSLTGLGNITQAHDITIQGNGLLTSLGGLSKLVSVANVFNVNTNALIVDFTGVSKLATFGTLYVFGNGALKNFSGLTALAADNGSVSASNNNAMVNLAGLENVETLTSLSLNGNSITSLTGLTKLTSTSYLGLLSSNITDFTGAGKLATISYCYMSGNPLLVNFNGLQSLATIANYFTIESNPMLTSFCGLDKLASVGGKLSIIDNSALNSLVGLGKLSSIGGLIITGNGQLTSLVGLDDNSVSSCAPSGRIAASNLREARSLSLSGDLTIQNNATLTNCAIVLIKDYLAQSSTGTITIGNNAPSGACNSTEDISAALPVRLIAFDAIAEKHSIQLNWATTEEINSDHFDIQHSLDTQHWDEIGSIKSKGSLLQTTQYVFTDGAAAQGINYYRLKMVDEDQTFSYSKMISKSLGADVAENVLYPNPSTGLLFFKSGTDVDTVQVFEATGKKLMEVKTDSVHEMRMDHLSSGAYIFRVVKKNGEMDSQKVIIK